MVRRISAVALIILLTCNQAAVGQENILDSLFTFRAGVVRTGSALNIITRQTGYNFTYDSRLVNTENKTDLTFTRLRLEVILDSILQSDSLVYTLIDKYIIISRALPSPFVKSDSETPEEVFYISGIISDAETKEPLPFATVVIKDKGKGMVSNARGEFGLKITRESLPDTISVSYLGYIRREIPIEQAIGNNFDISLIRDFISIPEIIIRTHVPQEIIQKCVASIQKNYGNTPAILTCFYREGVMKKEELQIYSEAILQIYKSSYSNTLLNDQVKIYKSRKIENTSLDDTLAIRLKAGLSTCLDLDGMRNNFDFMKSDNMPEYSYRITDIVMTDNESAYVIDFEQREGIDLPLFRGTMYINTDDYALLNADFELHPRYIQKMKESFVTSSLHGFDTWPVTVKYSVSYRKLNGRYFLNHVRGDLVFISRKKKKLFKSQFNVFFELAVTGIRTENVSRFEKEELAPIHSVFSKTITNYDYLFWENQDFLKPEENLLQALENMKVKLQEFSDENK
ncbi:MAG: carboxypeptidase-like regulatory domain-containing protein [Bacteroidia bacterium]|nr:carboxypeptidase-like regulatory domain-containing protein [Bacteroidia bacterium]